MRTVAEIAKIKNLSRQRIDQIIRQKKIPVKTVGSGRGVRLISKEDCRRYFDI